MYMNLLAEHGPQDLKSAWMYFKHGVKGRPECGPRDVPNRSFAVWRLYALETPDSGAETGRLRTTTRLTPTIAKSRIDVARRRALSRTLAERVEQKAAEQERTIEATGMQLLNDILEEVAKEARSEELWRQVRENRRQTQRTTGTLAGIPASPRPREANRSSSTRSQSPTSYFTSAPP